MRMIVLGQGQDLQALVQKLAGPGGSGASIERVKALNPHLDFTRLQPGSVLLVPDDPAFAQVDAESVAGEVFDDLAGDVKQGLKLAAARVRAGLARDEAQRKDVDAVLRSAAVKRALEGDAELKQQAAAASARWKTEQAQAAQTDESLGALDKSIAEELAVLGRLLR